jgi:hypothetical protein
MLTPLLVADKDYSFIKNIYSVYDPTSNLFTVVAHTSRGTLTGLYDVTQQCVLQKYLTGCSVQFLDISHVRYVVQSYKVWTPNPEDNHGVEFCIIDLLEGEPCFSQFSQHFLEDTQIDAIRVVDKNMVMFRIQGKNQVYQFDSNLKTLTLALTYEMEPYIDDYTVNDNGKEIIVNNQRIVLKEGKLYRLD